MHVNQLAYEFNALIKLSYLHSVSMQEMFIG